MMKARKKRFEAAGWRIGTAQEFLELSPDEAQIVEMKLALSEFLKRHRLRRKLTQEALAKRLGSSQSRVAKLESGALGVTLDLLFRAIFATGATMGQVAEEMKKRRSAA